MNSQITLIGLIAFISVGCERARQGNEKDFAPIENGFGYVTHVQGSTDRSLSTGLWYRDPSGNKTRVWPYLKMVWGDNIQITNNIAVLVGGIASLYDDGNERLADRLIAFEAPTGPPMDITDQVLQRYCAKSGVPFTNVVKDSFHSLTRTNDALEIVFVILKRNLRSPGSIDADGATEIISWSEMENIIQDVKRTGKLKNEKRSGLEYLQKD